ncbi:MAG TPA: SIS domain-containing protein [Trueperaceae bacterium]|nr:SIS domain-containing protein [Trueperaceae bacterium]
MLDDFHALSEYDGGSFLAQLAALPGSYDGPDGRQPEPYGVMGFGEASVLPGVLAAWIDAPLVGEGTQFLLTSGFDFGEVAALRVTAELSGASPIVLGDAAFEPSFRVPGGVLSPYTHLSYLANATGHGNALLAAEAAMKALAARCAPEVPTEQNPAKTVAWTLWNRVPLLLSSRGRARFQPLVQQVLARVGKTLAIPTGEHPTGIVTGAFEARHQLGDDVVGLVLGPEDRELALVREVLGTRIAQIENLSERAGEALAAVDDPVAEVMTLWYLSLWVAAYLALLHRLDPAELDVYRRVRDSAEAAAD